MSATAAAAPKPTPLQYQTQRAIVLRKADAQVVGALKQMQADVQRMLAEIARRPASTGGSIREAQLRLVQRNLHAELGKVWRELGKITEARRAEAVARSIDYAAALNRFALVTGGVPGGVAIAQNIAESEALNAASGIDRMIARTSGASYVPLKDRVYNSGVHIGGVLDRLVNSAIGRGLSAKEFAREARAFVNPLTPGGVSYAALRLARTEINNAAHAASVQSVRETPWVENMEWRLSGSHGRPDICDAYAHGGPNNDGRYPKGAVPVKPHPQCLCFVIAVLDEDDEFERKLLNGEYDQYLDKYRNLQPGQIVTTSFGGFAPAPPKPAVSKPTKIATPAAPGAKPPSARKPPTAAAPPARVSSSGGVDPLHEAAAKRLVAQGASMPKARNALAKEFGLSKEEAEKIVRSVSASLPNTTAARQARITAPRPVTMASRVSAPPPAPVSAVKPKPALAGSNVLPKAQLPVGLRGAMEIKNEIPRGLARDAIQSEMEFQAELVPGVSRQLNRVKFNATSDLRGQLVNGYYTPGARDIHMSARIFEAGFGNEQLISEISGFKTSCGSSHTGAQSVYAHEFGHHVDYTLRASMSDAQAAELWNTIAAEVGAPSPGGSDFAVQAFMNGNKDAIGSTISRYAATNRTELLAEIWREYSGNPNARPAIKKIGALIHKFAKEVL